jgi:hypothetical protein
MPLGFLQGSILGMWFFGIFIHGLVEELLAAGVGLRLQVPVPFGVSRPGDIAALSKTDCAVPHRSPGESVLAAVLIVDDVAMLCDSVEMLRLAFAVADYWGAQRRVRWTLEDRKAGQGQHVAAKTAWSSHGRSISMAAAAKLMVRMGVGGSPLCCMVPACRGRS